MYCRANKNFNGNCESVPICKPPEDPCPQKEVGVWYEGVQLRGPDIFTRVKRGNSELVVTGQPCNSSAIPRHDRHILVYPMIYDVSRMSMSVVMSGNGLLEAKSSTRSGGLGGTGCQRGCTPGDIHSESCFRGDNESIKDEHLLHPEGHSHSESRSSSDGRHLRPAVIILTTY